ncbi:hypothetical protein [Streptomyces sp. NPDC001568]|uniref:hypothetical protein n=1 Tax=Streptomyces sp. NPDC001568 TaxID=3364588 RepID=UPI0036D054F2
MGTAVSSLAPTAPLLLAGGIGYVAHSHPTLAVPITAAGMAVALVVACLGLIGAR